MYRTLPLAQVYELRGAYELAETSYARAMRMRSTFSSLCVSNTVDSVSNTAHGVSMTADGVSNTADSVSTP